MSRVLFGRSVAAWRTRLLVVGVGLAVWGFTLPVIFATFGADFRQLIESGYFGEFFEAFTAFAGGSVFTLGGSVALGFIHPVPIVLVAVFALGYPAAALAGERQRGTLEVLLARPISRRSVYLTTLAATLLFVTVAVAADVAGVVAGAALFDVIDELRADRLAMAAANATLLFAVLGAIALAASASFDRLGPALGLTVAFAVVSYAVEFLGAVWPELAWLLPWSVFDYFQPGQIIEGVGEPADLLVLGAVFLVATAYGLWRFPRRDLAAPS